MDSINAILTLRDNLRTNLTDPYTTAGGSRGTGVQWIYYNEPITSPKYPMIEMKKISNPEEVISIGSNYASSEHVFLNLWCYAKNGFKITVSGTEYVNSSLAEYMQVQIKNMLKTQFDTLFTAGIIVTTKCTTPIEYDATTQLYFGAVTCRIWFFKGEQCE